jgi:hypothetical protein
MAMPASRRAAAGLSRPSAAAVSLAERQEGARLQVHGGEPEAQRALDAPGDAALVVEQRFEAGSGETPHGEIGLGHDRRGAR